LVEGRAYGIINGVSQTPVVLRPKVRRLVARIDKLLAKAAILLNLSAEQTDRTRISGATGEHGSIVPFKSGERAKIEAAGYKIIQDSDLAGGAAECGFKLPNPFYFIP
jgi:hypothetical protein